MSGTPAPGPHSRTTRTDRAGRAVFAPLDITWVMSPSCRPEGVRLNVGRARDDCVNTWSYKRIVPLRFCFSVTVGRGLPEAHRRGAIAPTKHEGRARVPPPSTFVCHHRRSRGNRSHAAFRLPGRLGARSPLSSPAGA